MGFKLHNIMYGPPIQQILSGHERRCWE